MPSPIQLPHVQLYTILTAYLYARLPTPLHIPTLPCSTAIKLSKVTLHIPNVQYPALISSICNCDMSNSCCPDSRTPNSIVDFNYLIICLPRVRLRISNFCISNYYMSDHFVLNYCPFGIAFIHGRYPEVRTAGIAATSRVTVGVVASTSRVISIS